jgi:hypothetical protein
MSNEVITNHIIDNMIKIMGVAADLSKRDDAGMSEVQLVR